MIVFVIMILLIMSLYPVFFGNPARRRWTTTFLGTLVLSFLVSSAAIIGLVLYIAAK